MRRIGWWIFAIGLGWFILSLTTFGILLAIEAGTGSTPILPSIGMFDWAGGLLYFGIYFGSWFIMFVGGVIAFIGSIMRPTPKH